MARLRVPPGRTGRLWLRQRIALADRGVSLLERKLRILRGEQRRLRLLADGTEREWVRRAAEARRWALRSGLAGGQRALRLAAPHTAADAAVTWTTVMGVSYPISADCALPGPDGDSVIATAALTPAIEAHRTATLAAVRHAAARAALRIVDREVETTRVRERALRKHWLPRLRAALAQTELELAEAERAESIRLKLATRTPRNRGDRP